MKFIVIYRGHRLAFIEKALGPACSVVSEEEATRFDTEQEARQMIARFSSCVKDSIVIPVNK